MDRYSDSGTPQGDGAWRRYSHSFAEHLPEKLAEETAKHVGKLVVATLSATALALVATMAWTLGLGPFGGDDGSGGTSIVATEPRSIAAGNATTTVPTKVMVGDEVSYGDLVFRNEGTRCGEDVQLPPPESGQWCQTDVTIRNESNTTAQTSFRLTLHVGEQYYGALLQAEEEVPLPGAEALFKAVFRVPVGVSPSRVTLQTFDSDAPVRVFAVR